MYLVHVLFGICHTHPATGQEEQDRQKERAALPFPCGVLDEQMGNRTIWEELPWWSTGLPLGEKVQSLVWELRSCMKKYIKKKKNWETTSENQPHPLIAGSLTGWGWWSPLEPER